MGNITNSIHKILSMAGLDGKLATILSAVAILIIGTIIAKSIKKLVFRLLKKSKWDNKILGDKVGDMDVNVFVSSFVYFLIMLFVLLLVLDALGLSGVLDPIKNLLNDLVGFLPNLIAATVIGFVGYIIAKVVSGLIGVGSKLLDKVTARLKIKDTTKVISVLKKVVFIVIFIPFIIQALNALNINAISEPANLVLSNVMLLLPKILLSLVVIALFIVGGKYISNLITDLLDSIGVNTLGEKLHLDSILSKDQSLSKIIGGLLFFFIAFFGIITGVEILELAELNDILRTILNLTGQILFGLIILVIGNFIANLFHKMLSKNENNTFVASIARGAILALFVAISLRTMGIANSIVELAFGLILGAIAIAIALSYGLGGREAAGEHMKDILKKFRKND